MKQQKTLNSNGLTQKKFIPCAHKSNVGWQRLTAIGWSRDPGCLHSVAPHLNMNSWCLLLNGRESMEVAYWHSCALAWRWQTCFYNNISVAGVNHMTLPKFKWTGNVDSPGIQEREKDRTWMSTCSLSHTLLYSKCSIKKNCCNWLWQQPSSFLGGEGQIYLASWHIFLLHTM